MRSETKAEKKRRSIPRDDLQPLIVPWRQDRIQDVFGWSKRALARVFVFALLALVLGRGDQYRVVWNRHKTEPWATI